MIILSIHIIEIICQSVLSFIQIFTIIKIIYLIIVNLNKILQLQENYFLFLFRFCWKCFIALEKASHRTPPHPSRGGGNSLRLYPPLLYRRLHCHLSGGRPTLR